MSEDLSEARKELARGLDAHREVSERVVEAVRSVPRHEFAPEETGVEAYRDRPLPIGEGQTMSAPHMVAVMCGRLDLDPGEEVLEIGAGCGYHAAVTAELVGAGNVYTVEYSADLAQLARENLAAAGYGDVSVRQGDGRNGWSEHAPYDAAYLTCATQDFPEDVVAQVREGGRLLAPLGNGVQRLVFAHKTGDGLQRQPQGPVRFVRMR